MIFGDLLGWLIQLSTPVLLGALAYTQFRDRRMVLGVALVVFCIAVVLGQIAIANVLRHAATMIGPPWGFHNAVATHQAITFVGMISLMILIVWCVRRFRTNRI